MAGSEAAQEFAGGEVRRMRRATPNPALVRTVRLRRPARCPVFLDAGHRELRNQRPSKTSKTSRTPSANTLPSLTSNCAERRFAKSRSLSNLAKDSGRQSSRCRTRIRKGRVFGGAPRQAHRYVQRGRILTIPRHNPVNAFTLGGIARDSGLTVEQFRELL